MTWDWTQAEGDICECGHHRHEHGPYAGWITNGCGGSDKSGDTCACLKFNGIGAGGDSKLTNEARHNNDRGEVGQEAPDAVRQASASRTQGLACGSGSWIRTEEAMNERDMHRHREEMRDKSREQAESIVKLADFEILHIWELANGYWPLAPAYDDVRRPWWLFLTDIGPVQIGWRKRVINIEWETCAVRAVVTTDNVTKDDTYVHAFSVEKAVEYLRELRRVARPTVHELAAEARRRVDDLPMEYDERAHAALKATRALADAVDRKNTK